ncbi:MAG: glycine cleavage system protein GcvH [Pigmentiphaga sp.]|nr:glycine cleavage system protein GcvH [Pigmentiphaga sp.]
MNLPADLRYTPTHEWARLEDGVVVVGISDPAQEALGDLVFVGDVPVGAKLEAGAVAGVVESVKAASDIHAPVAGEVIAFNTQLEASPEQLNEAPYEVWIFKLRPMAPGDLDTLLSAEGYRAVAESA